MTSFKNINDVIFVIIILSWGVWCHGQAETGIAPMEKTEREALYSTIQGFVGYWWNGSELYPDPCGWTPIQVLSFLFSFYFKLIIYAYVGLKHMLPLTKTSKSFFLLIYLCVLVK